jgi:adenylate cyclase
MALYGLASADPGSAARDAIGGAVEMFRRLEMLNTRLQAEFGIELQMGIGIHSGAAIVGRMGPPRAPLLTAIGDNINIAARLESASKQHGCDVIISTETLDRIATGRENLNVQTIDIRGREQGIEVAMFSKQALRAFAGT